MSYDQTIKRRIVNMLVPGDHRHLSMMDAAQCKSCGIKMVNARAELSRLMKKYPEKFKRKEVETKEDKEASNLNYLLEERIKTDKLYQEHHRKLLFGTPEEKRLEMARIRNNFYEKHAGDKTKTLIL